MNGSAFRNAMINHIQKVMGPLPGMAEATIQMFNDELSALVDRGFTPDLALRTIATISQYVNGFVLLEQAKPREPAENPANQLATLAGLLDAGASAPLLVAIREGGTTTGDDAFEHGC